MNAENADSGYIFDRIFEKICVHLRKSASKNKV